jgi:hypothetical protein
LIGCGAIPVTSTKEETLSYRDFSVTVRERKYVVVGLLPAWGECVYIDRNQRGGPCSGFELLWPTLFVPLVLFSLFNWVLEPITDWDGAGTCHLAILGYCKATKRSEEPNFSDPSRADESHTR